MLGLQSKSCNYYDGILEFEIKIAEERMVVCQAISGYAGALVLIMKDIQKGFQW